VGSAPCLPSPLLWALPKPLADQTRGASSRLPRSRARAGLTCCCVGVLQVSWAGPL